MHVNSPEGTGTSQPSGPWVFYYDGECGFCIRWVRLLGRLDRAGRVTWVSFQSLDRPPRGIGWQDLERSAYLDSDPLAGAADLHEGFFAFRQLTLRIPALFPLTPFFWLPGTGWLGSRVYRWVAGSRYRLSCRQPFGRE